MPTFNVNIIAPCYCFDKKGEGTTDELLDVSMPEPRAHDNIADKLESEYGAAFATTITFSDKWILKYPIDGIAGEFKQKLMKYCPKRNIHMYLVPEIANGRLHYHGVTCFKKNIPIEKVTKNMEYYMNWLNRNFGKIHMFNRIYSYREEYEEEIKRFKNRKRKTSFKSIYDYIHKEEWWKDVRIIDTLG